MFSHSRKRREDAKKAKKAKQPKPFRCCDYMCSRCHLRLKSGVHSKTQFIEMTLVLNANTGNLEPRFEVHNITDAGVAAMPLDHWCFRCIAEAEPRERTRKTSKGVRKKLLAEQEAKRQARVAEIERQIEERQKRQEAAAKNKQPSVRKPKARPDDAPTLNLIYTDSPIPAAGIEFNDQIDYEILAARIARASDPTIFEEADQLEGSGDWEDPEDIAEGW